MESFRPSYGSNSKGDDKEINRHCYEIDMKEDSMDSEYEMFLNNLKQFGYGHDYDHEEELEIDPHYKMFLDSLDKPGNNMELSHESDDTNIHRKNHGSCSDLEIFELDNIPLHEGGYTPFVPSKCFQSLPGEESWDSIRTSNQSQFREKLMDRLKIPYDRLEFEKLWQEVTYRKPVQGVRELRHGRMKLYPTKTNGKSYLDWYKELGMKIDEFRHDRCKILYLLRGFFFWSENTSHEDAFQPWLDSLYLKALG